jgi:hypothetical protein
VRAVDPILLDVVANVTREELEAAHCLERNDEIRSRPAMAAFLQRTRLHQARWREAHGHPIGSQPYAPRPGDKSRPVGSRIPLAYARETGATFLTPAVFDAARARMSVVEPNQSIDHQRLWADLLSSEALAFNLFGDLAADLELADRAVHALMPDAPGRVSEIRFAYSPGRLDPQWLNSLRAFDAAIVLDRDDGSHGIVAIDTKYHERTKPEQPKPENLWRTGAVHERSGVFRPEAFDVVKGRSDLCLIWLEHLLLLSMLQHPSRTWTWGRYLVVHPAGNPDIAGLSARYRELLAEPSTFASMTIEELLDSGVLPRSTTKALRDRYVPASRTARSRMS